MADEQNRANDLLEKQLTDEQDRAWSEAIDAIRKYAQAQSRLAHYMGFKDGRAYEKKKFREVLKQSSMPMNALAGFVIAPKARKPTPAPTYSPGSAAEIVRSAITVHPGLTGVELLAKIHESGFPLKERTFRTALFRMKARPVGQPKGGQILVYLGRWYVYPDVPRKFTYQQDLLAEQDERPSTDQKGNGAR
jgi:hypothetical protein